MLALSRRSSENEPPVEGILPFPAPQPTVQRAQPALYHHANRRNRRWNRWNHVQPPVAREALSTAAVVESQCADRSPREGGVGHFDLTIMLNCVYQKLGPILCVTRRTRQKCIVWQEALSVRGCIWVVRGKKQNQSQRSYLRKLNRKYLRSLF